MKGLHCVVFVIVLSFCSGFPLSLDNKDSLSRLPRVGGDVIFEGDMAINADEVKRAINGEDVDVQQGHSYGLDRSTRLRWPNGVIPYAMSDSIRNSILNAVGINGPSEAAIRKAMKTWESKTCLKFVPRTKEKDYVEFIDAGFGECYSYVGRIGGKQKVSIGFGCFTEGVALHEIGHALGLHHEQSRPDRDQYVEIIMNNVKSGNDINFRKYSHSSIDSKGSPYDYGSIMHYGKRAFAKWPWMTTIKVKKAGASIGNRSHLSAQDIEQIKKAYRC